MRSSFAALIVASSLAACAASPADPTQDAPSSEAAGLVFVGQEGWIEEQPETSMRAAQYRLPSTRTDGAEASLIVYHFGAGGGSIEANLERWAGQFEQPDGTASAQRMTRRQRVLHGREVTEVDLAGTYVAETFPGSGEHVNLPQQRMLAAILPSERGRYYVKLVGPAATVAEHAQRFSNFLEAVR